MSNPKLAVSIHDDPPILVCADLQSEYLTEGRRHVIGTPRRLPRVAAN